MTTIGEKMKAVTYQTSENFQKSNAQVTNSVKNQKMFYFNVEPNTDIISLTKYGGKLWKDS